MSDLELYNKAKEAYYNGTPIMEDYEFDELEKSLGLENKSYIGAKKNPSYTVKHPFIMGSLSKVQIKEDEEGNIDWDKYFSEVSKYIRKNNAQSFIVTPKFDGCSFECIVEGKKIVSISSRGDGEYGKDLSKHLIDKLILNVAALNKEIVGKYILRGEVLIDKFVFKDKYSEFVNPRSFVSGILNRDYSEDANFQEMLRDLSIVIYDIRVNDNGSWNDTDWYNYEYHDKPSFWYTVNELSKEQFENIYNEFNKYRCEYCHFALDGIVFKPIVSFRENNLTEHRPKDCVAVKFVPELEETEVVDIKWQLSNKTSEYTPVIIVKPVIMDGKEVTRASAHNYGYVIDNKISIGTKVILSLAGDIIPFIYKITDTTNFDKKNIGINVNDCIVEGVHLYKKMSEKELVKSRFLASAKSLNIPGIGSAIAERIFDYLNETNKIKDGIREFYKDNILFFKSEDIFHALGGKLGENAQNAFETYVQNVSLKDIIVSCSFPLCGEKVAEQVVNHIIEEGSEDWTSLPAIAYNWCFDYDSYEMVKISRIMCALGKTLDDEQKLHEQKKQQLGEQIPIIMTGEPNNYATKAEFLKVHPEYRETGSWKEVKILFTNSLESNTSKMKKAKDKGIEIKVY